MIEKCDLSNSSGKSSIIVVWNHKKKNFEIPRWPSELQANQCRPVSPQRQIGRHELAGNSEGHRGIMIFFVKFVFYYWFCPNKSQFVEVAFFYHLKSQSYIVLWIRDEPWVIIVWANVCCRKRSCLFNI